MFNKEKIKNFGLLSHNMILIDAILPRQTETAWITNSLREEFAELFPVFGFSKANITKKAVPVRKKHHIGLNLAYL